MKLAGFGLVAGLLLALAGCNQEAGQSDDFPPIGGNRSTGFPPPNTFDPTLTSEQNDDAMIDSLTAAVDDALGLTPENTEPLPVSPITNVAVDPSSGDSIASDSGVLNLSLSSQEEQRILREADAAALQAAAAQRIVIEPGAMPRVVAGVNIIAYARSTTNRVGERVVRRPVIRRRDNRRECARFGSVDEAQRNFLANGGPSNDPLNLDPDGDGFACAWSPEFYRTLVLQ